jgi:hypothetical protein
VTEVHPIDAAIGAVARHIHARWAPTGFDPDRLAELAAAALVETDLDVMRDPVALIRWLHTSPTIPAWRTGEADFASPTVTVHRDDHLRIEVIVWNPLLPGTEHDHTSPGAFAVLTGARLHYTYVFDDAVEPAPGLRVGRLRARAHELLGPGSARPIPRRDGLIHSIFIVDGVATTIAVRSRRLDGDAHVYLAPGVAIGDGVLHAGAIKRLQTLQLLQRADQAGCWRHVRELVPALPPALRLFALLDAWPAAPAPGEAEEVARTLMAGPEGLEELAVPAIRWRRRRNVIEQVLPAVSDPDVRFVLGLLWGPAPRDRALALTMQRFPGCPPTRQLGALLERLARATGSVLGLPWDDPIPEVFAELVGDPAASSVLEDYDPDDLGVVRGALARHAVLGCWSQP